MSVTSAICMAQAPTLNLYTFENPPYQVAGDEQGAISQISGETVNTVVCAANLAGWSTRIRVTPQNRALHALQRNLIDGYFAIDPSTELDNVAKRSNPVALEKWYFFSAEDPAPTDDRRIGVVDGSNEKAWLETHDFRIFLSVSSPHQLLALLEKGRIDTALMDERVMTGLRAATPSTAIDLAPAFVRYAPLYLYLSETFASNHPKFLPTFNHMLKSCMAGQIALSPEEQHRIKTLSGRLISEMKSALDINQMIAAGPHLDSFSDVMTLDSMWQALAPFSPTSLAERILDSPGSKALLGWQVAQKGLVTETIVMNRMGTLAAMSQLTSDYWQGDEIKFQTVLQNSRRGLSGTDALYISPIAYDASTSQFQIMVSAPVAPFDNGVPYGVITFGLNAEQALRTPDTL
ncbi:substrate-binding periplasmic protein [Marinobacter sp. F3R08]|uniref:substrate-binding periplasmic protein n=1 Tax=Marinobacter sp. F3R08 TaxID=2841559 RepID=UPI001C08D5AD|nr:transporter substrate-binding domain-containing protein [Marinobacter sp. F3R08]MBU2953597.1 hypothetical protein [Marinobacter sp. F3R08]